MASLKAEVQEILDELPEDCSVEDIMFRLYLLDKLKQSEASVQAGRVKPHAEAMKEMREWLVRSYGPKTHS